MVKTLVACGALCIAAASFARLHGAVADRTASVHAVATDARHVGVRHATAGEPGIAPSSNDGNAAHAAGMPPVVALGEAHAGWSALFNH